MKSKKVFVLLFILFILIISKAYFFSTKYISDNTQKEYVVFIECLKSSSESKVSYNVKTLNTKDKFILNIYDDSYDNIKTNLEEFTHYKYGDVIKVKGKIFVPKKLNNPRRI